MHTTVFKYIAYVWIGTAYVIFAKEGIKNFMKIKVFFRHVLCDIG